MPPITPTALRTLQFLSVLLTLSLSCALIAQQASGGAPARINYTVFTSVIGIISVLFLLSTLFIATVANPLLEAIVQAVNALFYLAAAIAVSQQLGVHSCNNRAYLVGNGITNGGGYYNMEGRCREAQAMTFFLWVGFAVFLAGAVVDFLRSRNTGTKSVRPGTGVRGMSQVV